MIQQKCDAVRGSSLCGRRGAGGQRVIAGEPETDLPLTFARDGSRCVPNALYSHSCSGAM